MAEAYLKHFVQGKVELRLKLVSPESFPWEVSQTTLVQVLITLIQRYRKKFAKYCMPTFYGDNHPIHLYFN